MEPLIKLIGQEWYDHLGAGIMKLSVKPLLNLRGQKFRPEESKIMAAFGQHSPANVKYIVLGQDPYPDQFNANGRAFSCAVYTSYSVKVMFDEIQRDFGYRPTDPTLHHWEQQGILLLNRCLSVGDKPGSHLDVGWQEFTDAVIHKINVPVLALGKVACECPYPVITKGIHPAAQKHGQNFIGSGIFREFNANIIW